MENLATGLDTGVKEDFVGVFLGIREDNRFLVHSTIAKNDILYDV
jgi:hypothetical protein